MYSLFIDTHDKDIVLGLFKDDLLIDKESKISERNHSDFVMPMIRLLIDKNKISVNDLSEILVINGPGSFTGVRIGVTIAKTLAYTLNIPIKTMTSLEMYAVSSGVKNTKVVTIHDVKGVFAGVYDEFNSLIGELFYKSNQEFDEYIKNNNYENCIVDTSYIDLQKVYNQFKLIDNINPHKANPIYIKVIEALKND